MHDCHRFVLKRRQNPFLYQICIFSHMVLTSCHLLSKLKFAQNNRANTLFGGKLRNYIIIDNTDRGTADDCYSDNDDYS